MEQLKSDPKRQVIAPSSTDLKKAQTAFDGVVSDFAAKQAGETLLRAVKAKIEELHASE